MSIFISHSEQDQRLAHRFVDLLNTGLGVPPTDIFCSSIAGLGIPAGRNIIDFIKGEIRNCNIFIMLISENFMSSQFCQNELGVAVFMEKKCFPILIPPVTHIEVVNKTMIRDRCAQLRNPGDLDGLATTLQEVFGTDFSTARWNEKRDEFLNNIDQILQGPPIQLTAEHPVVTFTFRINALNILSFAKDVHNVFQKADIAVINMVLKAAGDLSCATDRGRMSNLIRFNAQWDSYKMFCNSVIKPKLTDNISQRESQVDKSFQFIKQAEDKQLLGIIGGCEKLYETIKKQIDEYQHFHIAIDRKSDGGFVNSIRKKDDAERLCGETNNLSKNVKDIISNADDLILEMIDSLL